MKVVALVGMPGAGKTEASRMFSKNGFIRIRFGDVTDEKLRELGLPLNEENERKVRESLRKQYGMEAYAVLNLSRIDENLKNDNVVVDGLYSWEEYKFLKSYYKEKLIVVAISSSPSTRYSRLCERADRPLNYDDAVSRDYSEIENINKAGPIVMADITVLNELDLKDLEKQVKKLGLELRADA
ncbi:dephospho-CoA kinase [Dehalococcoides mccartyi]|jgi:dephospho-CoA kinase|uniref:Dephospho-CoA kinase n=3 Tax=Dehalococcoides TaxID=61434 RepID=A0A142V8S0_9CHLR|nr:MULTISPECIES: AAA family ATPase [Dehalococcoides]AGG06053.1 hypothetical protein dcmb_424 [Dehalococcoides mccartyi DCMB5]AGG07485.1 hypothetical protein btf_378 [Dehalococcoides mccartyi BTF08]AII60517.1 dephospho-CoA kinase-like protein [Dehalococcoides mccartyi CG5]AMU86178.1 dephospho-CoA kinase [Dehalococcoides mccartyi]AOV99018.1 dephospho-CoA kinase-like [Dehalococcoides mccartyi]